MSLKSLHTRRFYDGFGSWKLRPNPQAQEKYADSGSEVRKDRRLVKKSFPHLPNVCTSDISRTI